MPDHILMIDDALPIHRIVASCLGGDEVEVHSAVDGATGLAAADRLRPTVILLDVDLPDVDGFEVCRRLKATAATREIPVIFLTSEGDGGRRQAGLDLGAIGYVTKPFRVDELSARVRASIRDERQRDRAAGTDRVTGLWTRDRVDDHLAAAAPGRAGRPDPAGSGSACVVANVDGLRLVNARHGPAVGDEVMRAVAGAVRRAVGATCGGEAAVCWAGGGTVGTVLPGDRRAGRRVAERVRDALGQGPAGGLDVSCGYGVADTVVAGGATLVGRAERALAHAKRAGAGHISVARLRGRPAHA